jgi:hypothetical protein
MTADDDYREDLRDWYAEDDPDGAALLHRIVKWYATHIAVTDQDDLNILALWTAHTYLVNELYMVNRLITHNPDVWGSESSYGKPLNEQRLGRMVNQAAKVQSTRPDHRGPRGFLRTDLVLVWHRLGVARLNQSGPLGAPGLTGPESAEYTDTAEWAGSNVGSAHTRIGAGPCPHCRWHPAIQGHAPACPSNQKDISRS